MADSSSRNLPPSSLITHIVCLGDILLDVLVQGDDGPGGGAFVVEPGGSAANTAAWLSWCGISATLVAAVGDDAVGELLALDMRRRGVIDRLQAVPQARSGAFLARIANGTYSHVATHRGANDRLQWGIDQTALLHAASHLHVSGYVLAHPVSCSAALSAAHNAHGLGLGVSLDLGAPHALHACGEDLPAVLDTLAVDILFANEEEATTLLGMLDDGWREPPVGRLVGATTDDMLMALLRIAPLVVLKRGAAGSSILGVSWATEGALHAGAPDVIVVDAVGAGDAFVAGFLVSWLGDASMQWERPRARAHHALDRGTKVAGVCVEGAGGRPTHS